MPSLANIYCHGVPSGLALTGNVYPDGSDTAAATGLTVIEATNRKTTYVLNAGVTGLHLIHLLSGSNVVWVGWTPTNLAITGDFEASETRRESLNLDAKVSEIPAAVRDVNNDTPAADSLGADIASAAGNASSAATAAATAATNTGTILDRLGAWTGMGLNTMLGAFRALWNKAAGLTPSDLTDGVAGASAGDNTTDSLPAIRDRGDAAWTTGGGGGGAGGEVTSFSPEALAQLAAAEITIQTVAPAPGRSLKIYRGCDHLDETGNAFSFVNPDGTWPSLAGCTVQLEVQVGEQSAAEAGQVVVASGADQEVLCELHRETLLNAWVRAGNGRYRVIRVDADGDRYPLTEGPASVSDVVAPS